MLAIVPTVLALGSRLAVTRPSVPVGRAAVSMVGPKEQLLAIAETNGLNPSMDDALRDSVSELILSLERSAPEPTPASSLLLNGVWRLQLPGRLGKGFFDSPTRELALVLYTAGFSPGVAIQLFGKLPTPLGVSLDEITVQIRSPEAGQPRVTTEVKATVFGEERTAQLFSNLVPVSGVRLREDVIEAEILGQRSLLPGPLARSRTIFITYLDEDLLISRDESGCAEVLVRKQDMRFSSGSDLSESSYSDDDDSPGAS
jgi:hypothetical protein